MRRAGEGGRSVRYLLFWLGFGAFCADVALGRLGIPAGRGGVLGDVGQFLLLALSAALLTAECLRRERVRAEAR